MPITVFTCTTQAQARYVDENATSDYPILCTLAEEGVLHVSGGHGWQERAAYLLAHFAEEVDRYVNDLWDAEPEAIDLQVDVHDAAEVAFERAFEGAVG